MPRKGYKVITLKEETAEKARELSQLLKKKSVAATVSDLIEEKYTEVKNSGRRH